jgi:hypothetical protein
MKLGIKTVYGLGETKEHGNKKTLYIMKKILLLSIGLAFLLLSFFVLNRQCTSKKGLEYEPANLKEAIIQLTKIFPDSIQQEALLMTEDEFLSSFFVVFELGQWIRNNWNLWAGGELADDFKSKGIFHPDDMSSIIIKSYYRQLHKQDWELDKQLKYYQDYWKEQEEYDNRLKTDTTFFQQEKKKAEEEIREENEDKKLEFPIGSLVEVWATYNSKDNRSPVIGKIVDWRTATTKGWVGSWALEIEMEYLEVKVKVVEFLDIEKKEGIERYSFMKNNELWVEIDRISLKE